MDNFTQVIVSYGGLGVLALFAWLLLKSVLKQQEALTHAISNHLTSLLERQELTNRLLQEMINQFREHEEKAQERHGKVIEAIRRG